MKENWIKFLVVSRKGIISQMPITDEIVNELGDIIADIPPDSILTNYPCKPVWDLFLVNKRINTYTAYRLQATARGEVPQSQEPEDIKDLVRSLTAYYQAQYNLIFDCWDYFKPPAIQDGLLSDNSQPRDALKIILDDGFTKAFISISKDDRSLDKQARSIHDRANRDIEDNRNILGSVKITKREISMSSSDWDIEYETLHPLLQLLLNVASKHGKKSSVIATASKHFSQTLVDYLREQKTYHRRLF